mmetsp:Transcript_26408/g.48552  ORF Transcript_26408/g.48552 Transcript_26408/m.48552 type:complete len:323 (+) Transcript_26408:78-1046(+)|eukprot:CAMPEP_0201930976 /NCGR_PEP_ID=MMETSP0903-20130614/26338_1 /ASSEMBLY_ACC=CAM_ASM_000552 /TAXON_ID=420261 /ORGANISM="Thalassiosira antarctica, Strain CCMP982" /LENGTH=322 /DNA_ID=CAMNT_0048470173 /DNA_START=9 /DNA_END=977 /DNA_ORIENTATION=+
MASRDLTSAFIERRTATNRRRRSSGGIPSSKVTPFGISQKKHGVIDDHLLMEDGNALSNNVYASTLPPDWVNDVDSVNATISDIQHLMSSLASMHASRIGTVFGRDLDTMERQIERKTTEVTTLFRKAEQYLKKVGTSTRRAGGEESTVGANVQRSLAMQLQTLSMDFRREQRKYLGDVKAQKSGGLVESEARFGINLEDDGTLQQQNDFDSFGGTTQQMAVVDDLQSEIQSRDKEISQIAKSIEELGSIFKELAVLVIDQGTILDRIDYNMEAVVEHTRTGIKQLEKAEKSQKSARPMKCIICLLCTVMILLLILVLKHRS